MVCAERQPVDIIDWIYVRDIVDLQWDALRYRRSKAHLITAAAEDMANLPSHYIMSNRRLSRTEEIAFAVKATLDLTERMDRMVMMMEARRDSAYRESKRHEASRVAQSIDQQNDIELRGIEHKPASANGNEHSTQNSG